MFRIKKYRKGYVVEIRKRKWYGKPYWTHYIGVSGISYIPWHFESYRTAMDELLLKIKGNTILNSPADIVV